MRIWVKGYTIFSLKDQVDNTVNDKVIESHPGEIILSEELYRDNKKKLELAYKKGVDYYEHVEQLYDVKNPSTYLGDLEILIETSKNKIVITIPNITARMLNLLINIETAIPPIIITIGMII